MLIITLTNHFSLPAVAPVEEKRKKPLDHEQHGTPSGVVASKCVKEMSALGVHWAAHQFGQL